MPGTSFSVAVNPAVLRWARESAGYGLAEAAARAGKSEQQLLAWEGGKRRPKWALIRKLAKLYRRPVASLLLPAPPDESPPPPDFRTLPAAKRELSPETRFAIRRARWLVRRAGELEEQLKVDGRFQARTLDLTANPQQAAEKARAAIGVSLKEQLAWGSVWQALRQWRAAVEGQHVYVFQFAMPVEEARGFSLMEEGRPAIVLNQSDAPAARIFTLFHEYAHLLLAKPGICTPEAGAMPSQQVETFCNRFAAALLVPRGDVEHALDRPVSDNVMRSLASRYSVSRYVVLGRAQSLGRLSAAEFHKISQRWRRQDEAKVVRPMPGGGGLSAVARCRSEKGAPFISLVTQAAERELITLSEATHYLGTKLKDYHKLAKGA